MIPPPDLPKKEESKPAMWHDTSTVEDHYSLKPEPYSIDSNQKDPELLGPQSTLKKPLDEEVAASSENSEAFLPKEGETSQPSKPVAQAPGMTRSKCISLIGKAKFDQYTKQFGSEEAAIRKCIILQRVQQN